MKLKWKVSITVLGIFSIFFGLFGFLNLNTKPNNIAFANVEETENLCFLNNSSLCFLSDFHYESDRFELDYQLVEGGEIQTVNFECNGLDIISYTTVEYLIHMELKFNTNFKEHELDIKVLTTDDVVLTESLYVIKNGYGIFLSSYSYIDATEKYLTYANSIGEIDDEKYEKLKNDLYNSCVSQIPPPDSYFDTIAAGIDSCETLATTNKSTYVTGNFQWVDDNNVSHPLRRIKVELYDEEVGTDELILTTTTDNFGNISVTFQNKDGFWDFENGGLDIYVKVYAGNSNVQVSSSGNSAYVWTSEVHDNVATGSHTYFGYSFSMSNELGQAFQISQALICAQAFAKYMMGHLPTSLILKYPVAHTDTSKPECYYSNNTIYIIGKAGSAGCPNSYASWDMLMHEYGHHIEKELDIIYHLNGYYAHALNMIYYEEYGKQIAACLAWSEGWATAFGMIAQERDSYYLQYIDYVNDCYYDSYNFGNLRYNVETAYLINNGSKVPVLHCELYEGTVLSLLWDLVDAGTETDDELSFFYSDFWEFTTKKGTYNLFDCVQNFYELFPEYTDKLGKLLSHYTLAANELSVSYNYALPQFSWSANSPHNDYQNNKFDVIIYDSNKNVLFTVNNLITTQYSLTASQWNKIKQSGGSYYYAVKTYQFDSISGITTGPYISAMAEFQIPG